MRELENGVRATSSHQRRRKIREFGNEGISKRVMIKWSFNRSDLLDKSDWLGMSEGNGEIQKVVERDFGEKRR